MRFVPQFLAFALLAAFIVGCSSSSTTNVVPDRKVDPGDKRTGPGDANPKFPQVKDIPMMKDMPFKDIPKIEFPKDGLKFPKDAPPFKDIPKFEFPKDGLKPPKDAPTFKDIPKIEFPKDGPKLEIPKDAPKDLPKLPAPPAK